MKKIALFGATGQTGQPFLQKALAAGYAVKALVRSPENITQQSDHLEVFKGDVLNPIDVEKTIADTDIVVSLIGHVKGSPEWLQADATRSMVAVMKKHGVERIISLSGGGVPYPEKDQPKFPDKAFRFIMGIFFSKVLNDAIKHAEILKNSGLKWVVVRGPRLTNDPATGKYRVGWVGVNSGMKLTRADLADFLVKQLEDETYNQQMPMVSEAEQ